MDKSLEICGLSVDSELMVRDAENCSMLAEEKEKNGVRTFAGKKAESFLNGKFNVKFVFNEDHLAHVLLFPESDEIKKKNDGKDTQENRWKYCKDVMENAWGKPLFQDKITVFYNMDKYEAFSAMVLDGSEYAGGRIVLQTKETA